MYYNELRHYLPEEILVYLRKSRSDDPMLSVEEVLQRHQQILEEWIERNLDGPIPEENYFREVVSGEQLETRPEMMKLLKLIESPKIKAVLVVEPQRLSRGDLEDCGKLIKLLRYTDTHVITPMKIYDITNEYDRDGFERELKRGNEYLEYTKKILKRGKVQSCKDGNFIGSVPPYGYNKTIVYDGRKKCPTLTINEQEAEVVRMIFDMYGNRDLGRATIAAELNRMGIKPRSNELWSRTSILSMLRNEVYLGKVKYGYNKTIHVVEDFTVRQTRKITGDYVLADGKHEPLISEELFNRCQKNNGKQAKVKSNKILSNPLASLIFCEECGYALTYRTYNDGITQARYQCRRKEVHRAGSIIASRVWSAVADTLEAQIPNFEVELRENTGEERKRKEQAIALLQNRLADIERKEISLWEKYTEEAMPRDIFDKLKDKITREKEEVTLSLQNEKQIDSRGIDYKEKIVSFHQAVDALRDSEVSAAEKNKLLKKCVKRITFKIPHSERVSMQVEGANSRGWTQPTPEINIELKF